MNNNLVENFLEFLQNDKKLSDNTLQSYNRDIKLYGNYLDENHIEWLKRYLQNYENAYGLFYRLYEPLMKEGVKKIRESSK